MSKRFDVVALHFTDVCNLNCPICYKPKGENTMHPKIFLELPKYLAKITSQVALGGGEPLLAPYCVQTFAAACKKNKLICNITSNGTRISEKSCGEYRWSKKFLKNTLKDVTMISLSIDKYKVKKGGYPEYLERVRRLKQIGAHVGANLLVDKEMFLRGKFIPIVFDLFKNGVDRVFALYPKNYPLGVDLREYKAQYMFLTKTFKHFYVDDVSQMVLTQGYDNWKTPCHFQNNIVSINWDGAVTGCSFDAEPIMQIKEAKDVLKLKNLKRVRRMECPFLKR